MSDEPINPFFAARRRASIDASIRVIDVQQLRPKWSETQATLFLEQHAAVVAQAMLQAGIQTLHGIMEAQDEP